ncbi:hypothetical protein NADFUDRAFT_30472 [Nadsonia fulvescens var. elongata DSM 6958]|uniref:Cytochrome c oxidase assembly protein COX20, mitochondrial n=1 Tax=Nadsonia fulvescens var. elongata DSM 6958 TaxID=857566 RepID=A0A1E3PTS1_9ASCO|nr:hypothetical protein NADFUDRAFT_30472 [Nadsonia fulvescens var. elongata DSM 6958]
MLGSLSFSDFLGIHKVPCFREGMLGGFIAGGCVFGAMITFRRPLSSAMNWAVGAWTVGSVGRWEQCRYERAKSFQNAQAAKEAFVRSHMSEKPTTVTAVGEKNK